MRILIAILTVLLAHATPVAAWQLQIGRVQANGVELQGVDVRKDAARIVVEAKSLRAADLDFQQTGVTFDCAFHSSGQSTGCDGALRVRSPAWRGRLNLQQSAVSQSLDLQVGASTLGWMSAIGTQAVPADIVLKNIPLTWLSTRMQSAWEALSRIDGTLDAQLQYAADGGRVQGDLRLRNLAFDSTAGDVAGADLQLEGPIDVLLDAQSSVQLRLRAPRGQLLLGPMYFDLPATASEFDLRIQQDRTGQWQVPSLSWNDAEGLNFSASMHSDAAGAMDIRVNAFRAALGTVVDRYLKTTLATAGFEGLSLSGEVHGSGRFADSRWQSFDLALANVAIVDPLQRIEIAGLNADLALDVIAAANHMQWQGMRIYKIPVGDGAAHWHWSPDLIKLSKPISVALLGGTLSVPELERRRDAGVAAWHAALELDQLDMLNLSTALDWPHFSGSLSGRLPGLVFRDGGFTAGGDLKLRVFDGNMEISQLSSERTFGVAPTVGASIEFDNLDLKQLSSALDFGEVEGWLDGEVSDLRLLDWAPMAFTAKIRTDADYPGKQRISKRAVQGLSSVGGGGSAASNPLMKMFESFPYAAIGLSCQLVDNVCLMGGLEDEAGGYTILRGSGLPRLTVVGHQRRVDWPVLLSRLQAASSGQAPVIE